jgi:hypothetical protein
MGAPAKGMKAVDDATAAEALLSVFEDIAASERRKHATVYNYWLSIRGDRHFPPIRDLDPLEISDAGPFSVLMELIGGGEDADIRHLGQAIKGGVKAERISEAPNPSLLSCIMKQLTVVSSKRQALAFEDEFSADGASTRCWVTLLPFSSTGTYVDYVYGFVTLAETSKAATTAEPVEETPEQPALEAEEPVESAEQASEPAEEVVAEAEDSRTTEPEVDEPAGVVPDVPEEPAAEVETTEAVAEPVDELLEDASRAPESPPAGEKRPGFSKLLDTIASVGGFYGNVVQMDPKLPSSPSDELDEAEAVEAVEEVTPAAEVAIAEPAESVEDAEPDKPIQQISSASEGTMQIKLADVRAKADEARMAKLRSNLALYEGLSAAYDFALDAEDNADEYLKLVEAQGLKIQLRAPMAPVVKLAFDGLCDDSTIAQLEKVLAWALKNDLPRGSLAERIEAEGGLGSILNAKAA